MPRIIKKPKNEFDAPCPVCGCEELNVKQYNCGVIMLDCPECKSKGTATTLAGAYSNMMTRDRYNDNHDTQEAIADSLGVIALGVREIVKLLKKERKS